ncbi:SURF1 family protein [Natronoglycomyces albus]|uniref:SURF1-like protein n=1 Tax=Natronoglycomyces albus TaxID=2811108 RepID=A0A895XPP9_9ACTN|nr:SURF1 family protein [Natronoglycomyces albus]QSB04506.1 SURF1 family protein [Natronoglycomyces albus]
MRQGYRFLTSPRWLGLAAFALVAVLVCALLATWQQGRATERSAANDRIQAGAGADPAAFEHVLPAEVALDDDDRWLVVEVTGEFDTDNEIVIRARPQDGSNGYEILTPLLLDDGSAVLINRGWIAAAQGGAVPDIPPAPTGETTVIGRVYEPEPRGGQVSREDGRWHSRVINVDQLAAEFPYQLRAGYVGDLEASAPFQVQNPPSYRAWQNYSYAVQWWLFAGMIPIGFVVLARREAQGRGGVTTGKRSVAEELAED